MGRALGLSIGGLAVVAIGILLLFWAAQRRLIYLPSADVADPSQVGLPRTEKVVLRTDDGLALGAWYVPASAPPTGDAVIVFNGNAGNRSYRADLAQQFAARGLPTLLFDYRGYGGNAGAPSEEGLALDARAARQYMAARADVDPRRIVYFGESLGAGVAVRLALEQRPRALILRSPFTSLVDAGRYHFPWLPVGLLLRDRYPSIDRIQQVDCPVMVIAAVVDTIVPSEQSRNLYDRAPEPKRLMLVQSADHNDEALVAGSRVIDAVSEYLRGL